MPTVRCHRDGCDFVTEDVGDAVAPHETWRETLEHREKALAKRHSLGKERWSEHTKNLPPLAPGDHVYVQNQRGNNPRRWERTGVVVEVKTHDQYTVKIDGSGRVTLRNRKFLRKFLPFHNPPQSTPNTIPTTSIPSHPHIDNPSSPPVNPPNPSLLGHPHADHPHPATPVSVPPTTSPPTASPTSPGVSPGRSAREYPSTPVTSATRPAPTDSRRRISFQPEDQGVEKLPEKSSRLLKQLQDHNEKGRKEDPEVRSRLRSSR